MVHPIFPPITLLSALDWNFASVTTSRVLSSRMVSWCAFFFYLFSDFRYIFKKTKGRTSSHLEVCVSRHFLAKRPLNRIPKYWHWPFVSLTETVPTDVSLFRPSCKAGRLWECPVTATAAIPSARCSEGRHHDLCPHQRRVDQGRMDPWGRPGGGGGVCPGWSAAPGGEAEGSLRQEGLLRG